MQRNFSRYTISLNKICSEASRQTAIHRNHYINKHLIIVIII